ncbi:putative transcriptional regulator [Desulfitobacterium dichloroeliminans LMG P-21439]|uniref:Putative transcriptional regulator n=1 Tax=Desulfitobacterium dichloroeliminans (strain LMG P-21439 / DCA1) TaxID=871963 RepID=L0F864_DESDL|nr:helix-turn-helix transcriptional regulator [Desulfitobacterium dichloroeliminans]AGA69225.1 putative transcriptional regulator [Desulfitobacterium dichloroeliminans LMG P-21439]
MKYKAIGKRIQQYREAKGYTQESFAEIVKLTPNYLSAIERGVKTPSVETLIEIINSLDVSADDILMDVINAGDKIKASKLSEAIGNLPQDEQRRIFSVVETLIKEAKSK